jgi:RNA polymerase primary sigma factor
MHPPTFVLRAQDAGIDEYYGWIRHEPLLSPEQELALANAIAQGDALARERLIRANLRLVVKLARGYLGRGLALEDLVGEGNLGLIRAVDGYDPVFGTRFSTYAGYWIRQAIGQALANTAALIRLPAHVLVLLGKWRRAERRLQRELGEAPVPDQVATELGLSPARRALLECALGVRRVVSVGSDEVPRDVHALAADPRPLAAQVLEAQEAWAGVGRRFRALEPRERLVLRLRFGLGGESPLTLREVGNRLGLTREWVRRVELRALHRLGDATTRADADLSGLAAWAATGPDEELSVESWLAPDTAAVG